MKYVFINLPFLFLFSCSSNSQNEKFKDNEHWEVFQKIKNSNFYNDSNKLIKVISKTTVYEKGKPLDLEEIVTLYEYNNDKDFSDEKTFKIAGNTKKLEIELLEKNDSAGNNIYEMSRNIGVEYVRIYKTYNNKHQLIKCKTISQTAPPFIMSDDEFNSQFNTDKPSFDTSITLFNYNKSGKLDKELTYDNSNNLKESKVYSDSINGEESYLVLDSHNDTIRTSPIIINKNPLTKLIRFKSGDSSMTVYENKKPVIEISHFNGEKFKYETKYDSHGNPIESISYH